MRRAAWAAALAGLLAGCAVPNPPEHPELVRSGLSPDSLRADTLVRGSWAAADSANLGAVLDGWLRSFEDERLDSLVAEALRHNADLRVAAARMDVAAGLARKAGARLYPYVTAAAGVAALSDVGRLPNGALDGAVIDVQWEIDIWGRVRAGRAAAREDYYAAVADYGYARQSLAALVARAWFLSTETTVQLRVAEEAVAAFNQTARLVEIRRRVGRSSEQDLALARADAARAEDALREVRAAHQDALRALEVLLGRYPAAEIQAADSLPAPPPPVPAGLPSELLMRRPDVLAAEMRLRAAFFRVAEAKASLWPRLSLTGALGTPSADLAGIATSEDSPLWSLGANLVAPLFHGGELKAQVQVRRGEQQAALANFGGVALGAFREVESALAGDAFLAERERFAAEAERNDREAVRLALIQYEVGATDLFTVLQIQQRLYQAQLTLARVRGARLTQRVNLHLALGGSFELVEEATPSQ
jgi:NodT family efflux transporter outer membrane factor (OMF) lipoprotein